MGRNKYQILNEIENIERSNLRYKSLKNALNNMKTKLNNSNENFTLVNQYIQNGFLINNQGVDKGQVKEFIQNNLSFINRIDYLVDKVNAQESSNNRKLRRLDNELAMAED